MAQQKQQEPNILDQIQDFYYKNKNLIIGIGAVTILIIGFFVYRGYQKTQHDRDARPLMAQPESYFGIDSFNLALFGDGINPGFLQIIDDYSRSKSANLSRYYAGVCFLNLEDIPNALDQLGSFSTSSDLLQARKYELMGHSYAQLSESDKAYRYYMKAANAVDDRLFTPFYLQETGDYLVYLQRYDEAEKIFNRIKEEYPDSQEGGNIDRHIQYALEKEKNS